ncbi:MAG: hypothetical protein AVDCRST_MAG19-1254 [uncultured Thermomicrobiales bacterium]|uniref:Uncharacterized protein n=1 Tax=uncultured Thermomicrobiales bacterium TaxID=1645740 RepID=A0A6J4UPP0_9BACT|nr:MAG: hypothetical protein AVDCRST_MAG19-1254 [uncultured Thermomicrobiales bacterium]
MPRPSPRRVPPVIVRTQPSLLSFRSRPCRSPVLVPPSGGC